MTEVRIQFSYLLYDNVSSRLYPPSVSFRDGRPIPGQAECEEVAAQYRQAWESYERPILDCLQSILPYAIATPKVDVYLTPGVRSISAPCILGMDAEADEFVDLLTHELIHILLTENTDYSITDPRIGRNVYLAWLDHFQLTDYEALVHIPVHAIHTYIYMEVLKSKDRLERDRLHSFENPHMSGYLKAWKYIDEHGYDHIIQQLRVMNIERRQAVSGEDVALAA